MTVVGDFVWIYAVLEQGILTTQPLKDIFQRGFDTAINLSDGVSHSKLNMWVHICTNKNLLSFSFKATRGDSRSRVWAKCSKDLTNGSSWGVYNDSPFIPDVGTAITCPYATEICEEDTSPFLDFFPSKIHIFRFGHVKKKLHPLAIHELAMEHHHGKINCSYVNHGKIHPFLCKNKTETW